ncbi:hypothetical protein ASPWEDRAFT_33581 [Aspergillus wentii DTO 134E9]|uniref:Uncharacterized protein n=1 Tax=Aspergillus wentii DTO 134E9 TaxID=1073089 RepID=A0A1L9RZ63_ASPWE|nr:uncharacterized protein ASPWEDRAFT_33581 [Aspergillus wentii DTO 134E9]OJJ40241.1 hypothetical protein ASPWEDRAFT_33581 [Aspergillus wentii DTO 134E9]
MNFMALLSTSHLLYTIHGTYLPNPISPFITVSLTAIFYLRLNPLNLHIQPSPNRKWPSLHRPLKCRSRQSPAFLTLESRAGPLPALSFAAPPPSRLALHQPGPKVQGFPVLSQLSACPFHPINSHTRSVREEAKRGFEGFVRLTWS